MPLCGTENFDTSVPYATLTIVLWQFVAATVPNATLICYEAGLPIAKAKMLRFWLNYRCSLVYIINRWRFLHVKKILFNIHIHTY